MNNNKNNATGLVIFLSLLGFLGVGFTGYRVWQHFNKEVVVLPTKEIVAKPAEIVVFSEYTPDKPIEIMGSLVSEQKADVLSKVSGTIQNVSVNIGDRVGKGQVLATFSQQNDITAINYQNALANLENVKISAQNSIRSAEIGVESAKNSAGATEEFEDQNYQKLFSTLQTGAKNSETTAKSALDWTDSLLGISRNFRNEINTLRYQIGSNDSVKKNLTKNLIEELLNDYENLSTLPNNAKEKDFLDFAEERLDLIKRTREVIQNINDLASNTTVTKSYPEASRLALQTQTKTFAGQLDGQIVALNTSIESTKYARKGQGVTATGTDNAVANAEAALELTKSTAAAQISAAENGVKLAQKSQNDLTIRAPFAGKISQKIISEGMQVAPGQKCFEIFQDRDQVDAKVSAQITAENWQSMQKVPEIKVRLADEKIVSVKTDNIFSGAMVEAMTQKIKIEFYIAKEEISKDVLLGSTVKILVPQSNGHGSDLLPISAISFEPDGAEVLVINEENVAVRRQIETGKIRGDSVSILEGLVAGDKVIKFRNSVFSGELIEIK